MTEVNPARYALGNFLQSLGFQERRGGWYRRTHDLIDVVDLQRSSYGAQYYINVAAWLITLGEVRSPKEHHCHIRTRLSQLTEDDGAELAELLDLDRDIGERERQLRLAEVLDTALRPPLEIMSSVEALRSPRGRRLLENFLVSGEAATIIEDA